MFRIDFPSAALVAGVLLKKHERPGKLTRYCPEFYTLDACIPLRDTILFFELISQLIFLLLPRNRSARGEESIQWLFSVARSTVDSFCSVRSWYFDVFSLCERIYLISVMKN